MGSIAQIAINLKRLLCLEQLVQSVINYSFIQSPFGVEMLIASAPEGVLFIGFGKEALVEAQQEFSRVKFIENDSVFSQKIKRYFNGESIEIDVLICVSDFRFGVLKALVDAAPLGGVLSYSDLAETAGRKRGVRAVASAVASNPVSLLIPCHRVVRKNGDIGKYRWGSDLKTIMIEHEHKTLKG